MRANVSPVNTRRVKSDELRTVRVNQRSRNWSASLSLLHGQQSRVHLVNSSVPSTIAVMSASAVTAARHTHRNFSPRLYGREMRPYLRAYLLKRHREKRHAQFITVGSKTRETEGEERRTEWADKWSKSTARLRRKHPRDN